MKLQWKNAAAVARYKMHQPSTASFAGPLINAHCQRYLLMVVVRHVAT